MHSVRTTRIGTGPATRPASRSAGSLSQEPDASAETISLRLGILDQRLLLVIPPRTAGHTAAAAMACAATTGNHSPAGELLRPGGVGSFEW